LLRAGAITGVAAASAALPIAAVYGPGAEAAPVPSGPYFQSQAPAQPATALGGFAYFNMFQAEIVNAAAGRLIPTDANGPGAIEAGVVTFIDRQLSASYGLVGRRYEQGPYANGTPTQGDQSGMDMRDRYRLGIQGMEDYAQQLYQTGFAQLSTDQQDRVLTDMQAGIPTTFDGSSLQSMPIAPGASGTEAGIQTAGAASVGVGAATFFNVLLSHAIAGFFADPIHGGNQDMVGWKLIGFPGAQLSYAAEISNHGVPFTRPYKSLAEYQGQFGAGA
jgi:gluconate 2-dehydrogenase gamma chain